MKVVPMIFNTHMVKALIAGDKRVTRRPVKIDYERGMNGPVVRGRNGEVSVLSFAPIAGICPFVNFGDLIYVRETFRLFNHSDECGCSDYCSCPPSGTPVYFATCGGDSESKWKPSIHMPRTESRLTLKVTDVRIERVQDITEEQAIKEGINKHHQLPAFKSPIGYHTSPVYAFEELWNSIYGNWEENPYVWVIEFEVIHQNVDKYLESFKERQ
ncbi:ASCH domain-containing protein [Vibrio cholerae]|uniref:hypothetical protein n=1 Tax=Vibrio cholerae TaxID=666 RepID=UPI0011D570ED|nr:hypothetical protein [Vibrio cholerae]TYA60802.1 hypothetical protein FXE55_02255 [Vibrio cholerae]GHW54574.1 Phage-related protein [Vibrio cholerae]